MLFTVQSAALGEPRCYNNFFLKARVAFQVYAEAIKCRRHINIANCTNCTNCIANLKRFYDFGLKFQQASVIRTHTDAIDRICDSFSGPDKKFKRIRNIMCKRAGTLTANESHIKLRALSASIRKLCSQFVSDIFDVSWRCLERKYQNAFSFCSRGVARKQW